MSWNDRVRPETDASEKSSVGKGVFRKCDGCGETLLADALVRNFEVCPTCGQHHRLSAEGWRRLILDGAGENGTSEGGALIEWDSHLEPADPLQFSDGRSYGDRVASAQRSTGAKEAIEIGRGTISAIPVAYGAFLFSFMGGSMGSVVGEKIARLFERAAEESLPVVLLQASGGARMQEGVLSLMQMAKTVAALGKVRDAGLPFISVCLHPTTGGVAASFALLGDVNIAEPKALIGFAGPRVIESTIRQKLPEGFQRSEFLLEHGMIDRVISRLQMKSEIATMLRHLR
jgi:acetyl-CoA carboxylase carboxyl transferase subunit beta